MPKFDPWPVFFKREWKRNWPFLVGFATTGTIITKLHLSLTEEDAKNSPYMQRLRGNRDFRIWCFSHPKESRLRLDSNATAIYRTCHPSN